jgi:predicted HNH restriction endonuclease
MSTLSVRWRPSKGRGEFEFVPAHSLRDRDVTLFIEALDLTIPTEVRGEVKDRQGKPRLRKLDSHNRKKLHLPQLVMAIARLPEPAREDLLHTVSFPLENKSFLVEAIDFDVITDDDLIITLSPLRVKILHSDFIINLEDRFTSIKKDAENISEIRNKNPDLANAIIKHYEILMQGANTSEIKKATDEVNKCEFLAFGLTNASSVLKAIEIDSFPETDIDANIQGKEGKLLYRTHAYKERDRSFADRAKKHYRAKSGGKLLCVACDLDPTVQYGENGERCIEAHHKIPIEELQPDSITLVEDMAMVCANCHKIIHSRKPCLTIEEVRTLLAK